MVTTAFRAEWGRVVATLLAVTGDWDLAEERAQDAFTREELPAIPLSRFARALLTATGYLPR